MVSLKFVFILFIAFLITPIDAKCGKKQKRPCADGKSPLAGYFCGRGPTRQDCPSGYQCVIAPNDAYAVCCPAPKEEPQPSPCANGSAPLDGYFCGRGPTRQDCPSDYQCVIAPNDAYAVCCPAPKEEPQPSPCANGSAPLDGYFCGRGPTRQDCPSDYQCVIAPNDAYAVCCPAANVEKPGSCPKPSDKIGICIARCTFDSDCEGKLKCCGSCPRECVAPVA